MLIPGAVAIVTGGARGLGRAFSEALLKRQARVCIADINMAEGRDTERYFRDQYGEDAALFVRCDVTNENDFKDLFTTALQKFKKLDLFVNNAGMLSERSWQKTIDVNLTGTMRGTNLAIEHMRKDKGGNGGLIINVASVGGLYPAFFMPAYIASKYGIVGFTRSWAFNPILERQMGLKIAVLCPGVSDTDMFLGFEGDAAKELVTFEENKEQIKEFLNVQGVNNPADVAAAFVHLVEKDDNNGAVLTVHKSAGMKYRFTKHPFRL